MKMKNKKFQVIKDEWGRMDESATQEAFEFYVGGVKRAESLLHLWNTSYPIGTRYDFLYGRGKTKVDVFYNKAKSEGYTEEEIDAFMLLE